MESYLGSETDLRGDLKRGYRTFRYRKNHARTYGLALIPHVKEMRNIKTSPDGGERGGEKTAKRERRGGREAQRWEGEADNK